MRRASMASRSGFERVLLGEDQRHVAAVSLCAIGFGRRVVDVGVGRDEEVFGVRPRNGLGVELAAVHDLDAVDQPFAVGRDLEFGVFEALRRQPGWLCITSAPCALALRNDCRASAA